MSATSDSTTGETTETNSTRNCTYWIRYDEREYITDPNADIVNLARLTAYAEYGKEIHDKQAHHELPTLKVDAPRFIDALSKTEHGKLDHGDVKEVDGFPVVRAES